MEKQEVKDQETKNAEALGEEALEATAGGVAYSKGDPGNPRYFRPGA